MLCPLWYWKVFLVLAFLIQIFLDQQFFSLMFSDCLESEAWKFNLILNVCSSNSSLDVFTLIFYSSEAEAWIF
jgi:hypothetical protein